MNELYINAGKKIRSVREQKNLTRSQLAEKSQISAKFLYEIETGKKTFTAEILHKICKSLEVSSDYILSVKNIKGNKIRFINTIDSFSKKDIEETTELLMILKKIM